MKHTLVVFRSKKQSVYIPVFLEHLNQKKMRRCLLNFPKNYLSTKKSFR